MWPLRKLFQYVWPQWPRIIAAVIAAIAVGFLQSISVATLGPIIRVMMDQEQGGLHGYIDSKACRYRFGMRVDGRTHRVLNVSQKSLAERARIQMDDTLLKVTEPNPPHTSYSSILACLATTEATQLNITLQRFNDDGNPEEINLILPTPQNPEAWSQLGQSRLSRWSNEMKIAGVDYARRAIRSIPRGSGRENTVKAALYLIGFSLTVTAIRCIAKFFQIYLSLKIMMIADCRLREALFSHILEMPIGNYTQESPSDMVSRIIRDTGEMASMLRVVFGRSLREPIIALFMLLFAMTIHWRLTLIFMLGGPLIIATVAWFGKKMRKAARRSLEASARMLGKLEESIAGIKAVKVFGQSRSECKVFEGINQQLLKQHLRISRVDAGTPPVLEMLGLLAGSAAFLVGVRSIADQNIDNENFLVLLAALGFAAESLRRSSGIWNNIQRANAAAGRIFEIMEQPLELEAPDCIELDPMQKEIRFQDISFQYTTRPDPTLEDINLTIHAGETVALVGPNGSGKTTLANLLPRFYDPTTGKILIDGIDIRTASLVSLRRQIGIVTQQLITFNETIAYNIAYGKQDASEAAIKAAAQQAHAHEFIKELPAGYQTVIGEHGSGLSGGQLQRIVIARAIVKNPVILIFDEATSQVDAESEAKIHDAIERIMKNRTTIIIAHRFSTVVSADKIVVIDGGRIIAQGQHEQLNRECPLYQNLYETQLM